MSKYKISYTFEDSGSLNSIFIKVLLKEIRHIFIKGKKGVSLSHTYVALDEGGNYYTFKEHK